jgi:hypothetical protein
LQEGGVTLITATNWKTQGTYTESFVNFRAFSALLAEALNAGVHAPLSTDHVVRYAGLTETDVPRSTLAQSLEPEFITFSSDSTKAYVVCQEANTIAVLDLRATPPAFTELRPLGWKDLSLAINELDPSDKVRTAPSVRGQRGREQPCVRTPPAHLKASGRCTKLAHSI